MVKCVIWKDNWGASIAWIFILMNLKSEGCMRSTEQQLGTQETSKYYMKNKENRVLVFKNTVCT
jgi:hypothetical protein